MNKIKINLQDVYRLDDIEQFICDKSFDLSVLFSEYLQENQNEELTDSEFNQKLEGESKVLFFVGYRNTGKTSYLKRYFNIENNSPYIQSENMQMVIPVLNTDVIEGTSSDKMVSDCLRGVCEKLFLKYSEAKNFYNEIEKFYQFIVDMHAAMIPELSFEDECRLTEFERKKERIARMRAQKKLSYYAMRLKFLIMNYCSDINKIIFVIDNLNNISQDYNEIKKVVNEYLDVFEHLKSGNGLKLNIYIVISVRPVAFRQLKSDDRINAYICQKNVLTKEYKIDTARLFAKIGELAEGNVTVDSDTISYENNLYQLGVKFKYKYSNMIEQLCFYDFDLMIKAYEKILYNETWIRSGEFRFSTSNVAQQGWSFNNITCIRALACGNKKLYRNRVKEEKAEPLDCLIPNLLYNTQECNYGVFILYTIKFFLRCFNAKLEYGDSYIVLKDYRNIFAEIFGDDNKDKFEEVISYLYQCEILRKSIADDMDAKNSFYENIYKERIGWESKMYITSRGRKLWDMLKDDSLLLELCREDIYRDDSLPEDSMKSSYDLMTEGKQDILFKDLLSIIEEIFKEETEYLKLACENGKQDLFRAAFGKSPLSLTLLEGVSRSIQYSGCSESISPERDKLKMYINQIWSLLS